MRAFKSVSLAALVFGFLGTNGAWPAPERSSESTPTRAKDGWRMGLASNARHTGGVILVPQQAPTIRAAVDLAAPGDTILVSGGVYRESVAVPAAKPGITIRGLDRNGVVLDGGDTRKTAIAVHADGVAIENLSAHNYRGNTFYWEDVKGFRGSYLTVWNVLGYGIYTEGSTDGVLEHDYVSGAADAAYYVGECNPCRTTMSHLVARLSAVGYSGTNASGGIVIRDSLWDRNAVGILPNSYANEQKPPQRAAPLVLGGNPGDDRVDAYEYPDRFQKQEAPLAVNPRSADEDDRADQVRDEVAQRGRGSDLEVQQRESPHVEGGSDQLDDDYWPHGAKVFLNLRPSPDARPTPPAGLLAASA